MRPVKIILLASAAFIVLGLGLVIKHHPKPQASQHPIVDYIFIAPSLQDLEQAEHWARTVEKIDAMGAKVTCYSSPEEQLFYQKMLPSVQIRWVRFDETLNELEDFLGFDFDKTVVLPEDLKRAVRVFMCQKPKTILISPQYLADHQTPLTQQLLFDVGALMIQEGFYSPVLYHNNRMSFYDELLITPDDKPLAQVICHTLKSRCREYQEFLAHPLSAEQIVQWGQQHPKKVFYYPAVVSYCFGGAFWADLFWDKRVNIIAIAASPNLIGSVQPLVSSPTFEQLEQLFPQDSVAIASWVALVGLSSAQDRTNALSELKEEMIQCYSAIPKPQQIALQHFYPSVYQHYLKVIETEGP